MKREGRGRWEEATNRVSSLKILFQYLLSASEDIGFKEAVLSSNSFQFCDNCDSAAKNIEALHLELETIQNKLISKLKQVKNGITSNSRNFEDWLDQLVKDGRPIDCERDKMPDLCRRFHAFIRDNDKTQVQFHIRVVEEEADRDENVGDDHNSTTPVDIELDAAGIPSQPTTSVKEEMEEKSTSAAGDPGDNEYFDYVSINVKIDKADNSSDRESETSTESTRPGQVFQRHREDVRPKVYHQCDLCSKRFSSKDALISHKIVAHNFPKIQCSKCRKRRLFLQVADLKNHERACHSPKGGETFKCSQCAKQFALKKSRNAHQKSHRRSDLCNPCNVHLRSKAERFQHLNCMTQVNKPRKASRPSRELPRGRRGFKGQQQRKSRQRKNMKGPLHRHPPSSRASGNGQDQPSTSFYSSANHISENESNQTSQPINPKRWVPLPFSLPTRGTDGYNSHFPPLPLPGKEEIH